MKETIILNKGCYCLEKREPCVFARPDTIHDTGYCMYYSISSLSSAANWANEIRPKCCKIKFIKVYEERE